MSSLHSRLGRRLGRGCLGAEPLAGGQQEGWWCSQTPKSSPVPIGCPRNRLPRACSRGTETAAISILPLLPLPTQPRSPQRLSPKTEPQAGGNTSERGLGEEGSCLSPRFSRCLAPQYQSRGHSLFMQPNLHPARCSGHLPPSLPDPALMKPLCSLLQG